MHGRVLASVAIALSLVGGCSAPPPTATNVLIVVLDTVRADHLGLYGHERATSPNLDLWSGTGAVFERALTTSPWTLPSVGSLYTGRIPSRHRAGFIAAQVRDEKGFLRLRPGLRTQAEIVRGHGFDTAAWVNNPYLHPRFGTARGFAVYDHADVDNVNIRRADETVDLALEWLDERTDRPFLMLTHFFDPHMNYDPPESVRGRFTSGYDGPLGLPVSSLTGIRDDAAALSEADLAFLEAAYDEELAFVDEQLGRLLDGLSAGGHADSTLLVVLADHGEEFFDHGGFEHGHSMYRELLRVPLVVVGPGVQATRVAEPVSITDVLPTLLEALGLPAEHGLDGRSLWGVLSRGEAAPKRDFVGEATLYGSEKKTLLRWPHKLILDGVTHEGELFRIDDDPGEQRNLMIQQRALVELLSSALDRTIRAALAEESGADETAEIPDKTRERLRSLGYVN